MIGDLTKSGVGALEIEKIKDTMKNFKVFKILKSKQGASLILVLCVMVLLMGISGSVLFAASTAAGGGVNKMQYDQIAVYSDSIIRTITYNICNKEVKGITKADKDIDYLGGNIFFEVGDWYNKSYNDNPSNYPDNMPTYSEKTLEFKFAFASDLKPEDLKNEPLKMEVTDIEARVTPFKAEVDAVYETVDGNEIMVSPGSPREPQKLEDISFTLKITLESTFGKQKLTSVATYKFTNGELQDKGEGTEDERFDIVDSGNWRMVSYERKDT